jgi:predicted house-cleaning noncanonical NTP pyrophosphatase (MazG superfamily)
MSKHDPILVKLVRDKVFGPNERYLAFGETISDEDEVVKLLRKKLIEEAVEYMENPSIEEAADVYEVLLALLKRDLGLKDMTLWHLEIAKFRKVQKRGRFDEAIGFYIKEEEDD